MSNRISRREFLETSGKAALGVGLGLKVAQALGTPAYAQTKTVAASEKIRVGFIGVGGMGNGNLNGFMEHPEVQVVAVSDVHQQRMGAAAKKIEDKYGRKPFMDKDFRKILDRNDIDAVAISTPDHWHALPFIMACEAGKDVFCEKPISHDIVEAQSMLGAAKHYNRIVQIDTWQRSAPAFQDCIDFVRSGKMGKIAQCRAWMCGDAGIGKHPIIQPPAGLDWDLWLGPAPKVPYHDAIDPGTWRWYYDYGTGMAGDWGVHMIDIVLLGMNSWHPLEVASVGGKLRCAPDDDRTTPDTMLSIYKFPDFVMNWEVHVNGEGLDGGDNHGSEFIGENGRLSVSRNSIKWNPYIKDMPGPEHTNKGDNHIGNFLKNMKSRGKCTSDIETMAYTTIACHLANLSYQHGKSITWDGQKGVVVGDNKAMQCPAFHREYRKPWKLPIYKWNA